MISTDLKSMLKTLDQEQWKAWDKYILYFLFTYGEVPQDSTGFSPFEFMNIVLYLLVRGVHERHKHDAGSCHKQDATLNMGTK